MSTKWTEEGVRRIMQINRIGTVSRVDFTLINKRTRVKEGVDNIVMSAFVHFSDPYITDDNHHQFRVEMYMGNTEFWEAIESGSRWKLKVLDSEYWKCLQNKKPVQLTIMKNHEIAENGCHLEKIVTEQAEEIKMLKSTLAELTKKLDGVHNVFDDKLYHQKHSEAPQLQRIDELEKRLNTLEDDLSTYKIL
jgi:uncharacterized coiled-coil protein SlyX